MNAIKYFQGGFGLLASLSALLGGCSAGAPDPAGDTSGAKVVGDTTGCKDQPIPMLGCAEGQPVAQCQDGVWSITCPGDKGPCAANECGPALGMPNQICSDGSVGGPVCKRDEKGKCGYVIVACPSVEGVWGGAHLALTLTKEGGSLEFDCGAGSFGPLTFASDGSFAIDGTFTRGSGVEINPPPAPIKAKYWGKLSGDTMKFYVQVEGSPDSSVFDLVKGKAPFLTKCQ